jgi:capsular polysaccharide export protein
LRSVGLGSDFTAPASLVLDSEGLYDDARQPSSLESLLGSVEFAATDLSLAKQLREQIVRSRVSKYNLGSSEPLRLESDPKRPVILIPGQVEDDASIRYGTSRVRTNAQLLREVRSNHPDAYLLYKPHPEVVSGNRSGVLPADEAHLADRIVEGAQLASCLEVANEVHTMTSLVGFEGLMWGRKVVCYGQPFYAGWGLTSDIDPPPRRTRALTLDQLCAGVLLSYPRYYCFRTKAFITAHQALDELSRERGEGVAVSRGWASRQWRRGRALLTEVLHAR